MREEKKYLPCDFLGCECTKDGDFRRLYKNGKYKEVKVTRRTYENGRKQTAYISIMDNKKLYYHAANTLVAYAWCKDYEKGDYVIHKDGDLHNIASDNLCVCGKETYTQNRMRNAKNEVTLKDRIKKLEIIKEETEATLALFKSNDWTKINAHVEKYLVPCLMDYGTRTIHLSKNTTQNQVPEIIALLYQCLDEGYCVYNYERWCKQMLINYKKNGSFGNKARPPKRNIRQIIPQETIKQICDHFNVNQYKSLW